MYTLALRIAFGLLLVGSSPTFARAYRCTDADGNTSYSQIPCTAGQTGDRVHGISSGKIVDREVCVHVRRFASESFDKLKDGMEPSALIGQYGGPGYINKVTLNVINFASGFRYNKNVSALKVGTIAYNKCTNRGFGNLQTSELPAELLPAVNPVPETPANTPPLSGPASEPAKEIPQFAVDEGSQQQLCLDYKQQLKELKRSMRKGYRAGAGRKMLEKRRQYEIFLRKNCRR